MERPVLAMSSVDAQRFFALGRSMLDVVVRVQMPSAIFNGVRITSELVVSLRGELDVRAAPVLIAGEAVEVAWTGEEGVTLFRTARGQGALPDLSLGRIAGNLLLLWINPADEVQVAFGRALGDTQHDVPTAPGAMGAPLFDDEWGLVGLHASTNAYGVGGLVSLARVLRQLEEAPCWDEVAAVHRLVRTTPPTQHVDEQPDAIPTLAQALRWTPDDHLPTRARRRAFVGKTIDELRAARGAEPAITVEQRAVDRILAGPPYAMDTIADDILLPFATAVRWFRHGGSLPLPDDATLAREIGRRRQASALTAIVGSRFAGRDDELAHLHKWLDDRDRRPMVIRGPGGIGKSALLACFAMSCAENQRRVAWLDFDRPDVSADEASIAAIVDEQLSWQHEAGTLLLVLDSFETAVQTYGYSQLNPALDALARRFDDLAVVVGSRAPVPLLQLEGDPAQEWELPGLPPEAVTQWLVEEGIAPAIAERVVSLINGVPLNMKLARALLAGKDEQEANELAQALPNHLITGYLYRRILSRLSDDSLRQHAKWAMVPRRLTPELLRRIADVDQAEGQRLFEGLRDEFTLFDGAAVLSIRADLRNTLLPLLESDNATRVREIDELAAAYWMEQASDDLAAAEAVYHNLRLGRFAEAEQLWRDELARRLGGYTMEEVPASAQTWLEVRATRVVADQTSASLASYGKLDEARAALHGHSTVVGTLSQERRTRRLNELAASSGLSALSVPSSGSEAPANASTMEAAVIANARPVIRARDGDIDGASPYAERLSANRPQLQHAIRATGRIVLNDKVIGTATLISKRGLLVTTRAVVDHFAVGIGREVQVVPDKAPWLDMHGEAPRPGLPQHPVTRVVLIHPFWNIAIVEVTSLDGQIPLSLATREPEAGTAVAVMGHPSRAEQEQALAAAMFEDEYDVKRIMPGTYMGRQAELSFGRTVSAGTDDALAISPDDGAAVIDPETGQLLGVRFSWVFLRAAKFVPMWELARDPLLAEIGVRMAGEAEPDAPWLSAWEATGNARHVLLDAYLARSAGDLARALALLDLFRGGDQPLALRIDSALLRAACLLVSDPMAAAETLHALVTDVAATSELPNHDVDAIVATRLRLAVDAEAEMDLLECMRVEPLAVGLVKRDHFRVVEPPAARLPWGRDIGRGEGRGAVSNQATQAAIRVIDAAKRCVELQPWIERYGRRLAATALSERPLPEARELAGAFVAYSPELAAGVTRFLLGRLPLAPHPTLGWQPLVRPLALMFLGTIGELPADIESNQGLAAWLDENARTGGLDDYLVRLLGPGSEVAWQAGLLHLSSDLPIESVLRRRFITESAR